MGHFPWPTPEPQVKITRLKWPKTQVKNSGHLGQDTWTSIIVHYFNSQIKDILIANKAVILMQQSRKYLIIVQTVKISSTFHSKFVSIWQKAYYEIQAQDTLIEQLEWVTVEMTLIQFPKISKGPGMPDYSLHTKVLPVTS